jgi:hypothetical protein
MTFIEDRIVMENLRVRDVQVLGSYSSATFRAHAFEQYATEQIKQMAIEFQVQVLAQQRVTDKQVLRCRCPASWWQHLKWAHAPRWLLRRWPVVWTDHEAEVSFTQYDTYPRANVPLPPEFGRPVTVNTITWAMPPVGDGDSPCTVFRLDGRVSPGRQLVSRKNLQLHLVSRVFGRLTGYMVQRPPPTDAVISAVLDELAGCGVDLDALIQQQDLEGAR